jgi:hypothetical protein
MSDEQYVIETWEDEPSHGPYCEHCGSEMSWERCDQCEDGYSDHDCGEDCCCCLVPEPNVRCGQCGGKSGWWWCWNSACPGKHDDPAERVGAFGEPAGASE